MKRPFVTLMAIVLATAAFSFAQPVIFELDDSGVVYSEPTASGSDVGYLQIVDTEEGLELVVSQEELDTPLPAIQLVVPDRGDDQFGLARPVGAQYLEGVELLSYGNKYMGFGVLHQDAELAEVVAAYEAVFSGLGFSSTVETEDVTLAVRSFDGEMGSLRAVFRLAEGGISVHVSSS